MIEIKNISKSFSKKRVLSNISFSIKSNKIICLIGPSGAGKTTLIRLILGAIPVDEGSITFDGIKVPNLNLLKHIGYMPQNDALYDDLTGEDNLRFFGSLYKMEKQKLTQRIEETLNLVDLSEDKNKLVRFYSGGMKKRLSLATALLNKPNILLLDEPTVGIDPVLRRTIWAHFAEMREQGITLIVSTHVMDEVKECDKAALLYNGQLLHFDDVEKLIEQTDSKRIEELFFKAAQKGEM